MVREFDARLSKGDNPGAWTCGGMDDAAERFGTRLVVVNGAHGGRYAGYGLGQFGDWNDGSSTYVQDNYNVPNLGAIATKRDQVRRFLDATSAGDPARMYVNFASGASVFAQPQSVAGGALGVQGVDPFLYGYLNDGLARTGAIMLDFPGSGLINKILAWD